MRFFRKPALANNICATNEHELEKALAKLKAANVNFDEATEILEGFITDFRKKQRRNYEQ